MAQLSDSPLCGAGVGGRPWAFGAAAGAVSVAPCLLIGCEHLEAMTHTQPVFPKVLKSSPKSPQAGQGEATAVR